MSTLKTISSTKKKHFTSLLSHLSTIFVLFHVSFCNLIFACATPPRSLGYSEFIAEYKAHIDKVDPKGKNNTTTIHYAAQTGRIDILAFILKNNIDINIYDNKGCTSAHYAATHNQTHALAFLIDNKADINEDNFKGITPLHLASKANHTEIIQLLLQHNARYKQSNNENDIPLHFAAYCGSPEAVQCLLHHEYQQLKKNYQLLVAKDMPTREQERLACITDTLSVMSNIPSDIIVLVELYKGIEQEINGIVSDWEIPSVLSTFIKNKKTETPLSCAQSRLIKEDACLTDQKKRAINQCIELLQSHPEQIASLCIHTMIKPS